MNELAKYSTIFKEFMKWYDNIGYSRLNGITIISFMTLPIEFQIGVFLRFLEDIYDIGIHADDASYVIYYLMKKKLNTRLTHDDKFYIKENYTGINNDSTRVLFKEAVIEVFNMLENPF